MRCYNLQTGLAGKAIPQSLVATDLLRVFERLPPMTCGKGLEPVKLPKLLGIGKLVFSASEDSKHDSGRVDDWLRVTCAPSMTLTPVSCTTSRTSSTSVAPPETPSCVPFTVSFFSSSTPGCAVSRTSAATAQKSFAVCSRDLPTPNRINNESSGDNQ